ncbi:hypothetical protein ACHAWF_013195 [Thalassiosira exigua]
MPAKPAAGNRPLEIGSNVWERKKSGARKGKIVGHASVPLDLCDNRKGQWRVRWDNGTEEDKTTAQLRKQPPEADRAPSISPPMASSSESNTEPNTSSSSSSSLSTAGSNGSESKASSFNLSDLEDRSAASSPDFDVSAILPNDPKDELQQQPEKSWTDDAVKRNRILERTFEHLDISDDEISCHDELDPDLDVKEEDIRLLDEEEDDALQYRDETEVQDPDEARRASRQKAYEEQKERLIKEAVEFVKKVNRSRAVEIGAMVQTRKKDPATNRPKKGIIFQKVYNVDGSSGGGQKRKYSWKVRLESGVEELFTSQQLKGQDTNRNENDGYIWKVVWDHFPDVEIKDYDASGFIYRIFPDFEEGIDVDNKNYKFPFASLFEALWPGSSKGQLEKMNAKVREFNNLRQKNVKDFTLAEWWHGIGIILLAGPNRYGGVEKLYNRKRGSKQEKHKKLPSVFDPQPLDIMSRSRFEDSKKFFPHAFEGHDPKDPWNQIMGLVKGFNSNRKTLMAASFLKIMDELMSAFQPRSTPDGGLPHFSYVSRKPRPFGVEFKVLVCGVTKIMLYLEIQRGKEAVNGEEYGKYAQDVGPTAAFIKGVISETANMGFKLKERRNAVADEKPDKFMEDSWFASCKATREAQKLGHEFFGPIKTATAGFPKDEIKKLMEDWPSGSYIVLEREGHKLFAVEYKYSLRSKRQTTAGKSYMAKWADQHGNVKTKPIPRPEVISDYFSISDVVDNHNKSRQGDLALEEPWRTTDCWLSLATTFLGLTATDAWNRVRHYCTEESGFPDMSINRFVECVVYDLWNKPWGKKRTKALVLGIPDLDTLDETFDGVEVVLDSPSASLEAVMKEHILVRTEQKESGKRIYRVRRSCKISAEGCKARSKDRKKTILECGHDDCMKEEYKANSNVSGGIFICQNDLCLKTHCQEVWSKRNVPK